MMQSDQVVLPLAITETLQGPSYRLDFKGVAEGVRRKIQQATAGVMGDLLRRTMPELIKQQGQRWLHELSQTIKTVAKSKE